MALIEMFQVLQDFTGQYAGKAEVQPFFEAIHQLALTGMNIGQGDNIETSGELFVLEHVKSRLSDIASPIVFDVGANVGNYSVKVIDIFGNDVGIYAFEPSLKTFQVLQRRLGGRNISLYNFGLSDETGVFTLFTDADNSGLASLTRRRLGHLNIGMNRNEKVYIRTIDEFCQEQGINRINLLKVDVEGWEMPVFKGARQMLDKRAIDFIQFEFGGCNIDTRTFFQDFWHFFKDDFLFYRVVNNGLFPINSYKEQLECFLTTNYFLASKHSK